jgi:hypothetical protein
VRRDVLRESTRVCGAALMHPLIKFALWTVAIIAGVVLAYKFVYPTYTYRYRMTVEVPVGDKIHSGSSVIEVRLVKQPQFLVPVPPVLARVTGEAVFVDLGAGKVVIALLASRDGKDTDFNKWLVSTHFKLSGEDQDLVKYSSLRGRWTLDAATSPPSQYPTLITFDDLQDGASARIVLPQEFPTVFGTDVRPPKIIIEMTSDPVTSEIEKKLPWWNGPFPWLKREPGGSAYDTRQGFKWHKGMFKRDD